MIFVIMPLGKAARQVFNWLVQAGVYVLASTLGGAVTGLVMAFSGSLVFAAGSPRWLALLIALVAVAYVARAHGLAMLPFPSRAWQVPNSWQRRSRLLGALAFGFVLGAGVFTFIEFGSFYVLLLWEFASAAPAVGALLGAVFGLMRGAPVIIAGLAALSGKDTVQLNHWILNDAGIVLHLLDNALLLFIAAFLVGIVL